MKKIVIALIAFAGLQTATAGDTTRVGNVTYTCENSCVSYPTSDGGIAVGDCCGGTVRARVRMP